jgi:nitrate reductase gamma subunit
VHIGGALAAVAAACALPVLMAWLLGPHWPVLLLPLGLAPLALVVLFVAKVARWMRAPVPFRIPLTTGQQRGLAFIIMGTRDGFPYPPATGSGGQSPPSPTRTPRRGFDNPHSTFEVVMRVLLDVFLLRPLFRATPTAPRLGQGLAHGMARWLWLFAAAFHGALAIVALRHLRMFLQPAPHFVAWLDDFDVATEMFLPKVHATSVLLLLALLFLLGRRLVLVRVRYISLAADYFPLFLLLAIAVTGIVMRHLTRTDVTAVQQFALGLAAGKLVLPARADPWLLAHVFSVGTLLVYFPLSKLMHLPGALLSPTLTLANNNREHRYINARNPQVEVLHYADYEAAFRDRMIEAGLPVEKE